MNIIVPLKMKNIEIYNISIPAILVKILSTNMANIDL